MSSNYVYPEIILNDLSDESLSIHNLSNDHCNIHNSNPDNYVVTNNSSKLLSLETKPASFEDSTVNQKNHMLLLPDDGDMSECLSRRYSDTSIWDYQNLNNVALQRSKAISRRRRLSRQAARQKNRNYFDEISFNILGVKKTFGGFKQLQKIQTNSSKKDPNEIREVFPKKRDRNLNQENKAMTKDEELGDREEDDDKDNSDTDTEKRNSEASLYTCIDRNSSNKVKLPHDQSSDVHRQSESCVEGVRGFRLGYRKRLQEQRRRVTDYTLLAALCGIFLMILLQEFQWAGVIKRNSTYSFLMKTLITISTVALIAFVIFYHILVVKLLSCDDCLEDWKITVTWQRIMQMTFEVLVCMIHPFPFIPNREVRVALLSTAIHPNSENVIDLDVFLSLPMFLRLYVVFRVLLLHSRLFSDATLRSIGAFNKVKFDTRFLLKTLLTICPATVFILFLLSMWLFFSWILRACEIRVDKRHNSLLNSTWLIAVTFLSVGYGEIVPHTSCGRGIALSSGVMGSACTALIVAVLAKKLELTKAEQHVTHFIMESSIKKKLRNCAANVLRETWLIYKLSNLVPDVDPAKIRVHQRKFLTAIHGLRNIKIEQRKIRDQSNTLVDLAKTIQTGLLKQPSAYISQPVELYRETQQTIFKSVTEMREDYVCFHKRIEMIEKSVLNLQKYLTQFTDDFEHSITT